MNGLNTGLLIVLGVILVLCFIFGGFVLANEFKKPDDVVIVNYTDDLNNNISVNNSTDENETNLTESTDDEFWNAILEENRRKKEAGRDAIRGYGSEYANEQTIHDLDQSNLFK